MDWHYIQNGVSTGPIEQDDLLKLFHRKIVTVDTPVWTEGMIEWQPLRKSALASAAMAVTADTTQSVPRHMCTKCGKVFEESGMVKLDGTWLCTGCKPVVIFGATPDGNKTSIFQRLIGWLLGRK